ncbi:MAG: hypothetical protein WCR67_05220 [Bacilli bacterium]
MKINKKISLMALAIPLISSCATRGEGYETINQGFRKAMDYLTEMNSLDETSKFLSSEYLYAKSESYDLSSVSTTTYYYFYKVNFSYEVDKKQENETDYLKYYDTSDTIVTISQSRYESLLLQIKAKKIEGRSGSISPADLTSDSADK